MARFSFNHVVLVGTVTRDPDLRTTPDGKSVAQFTLRVTRQTEYGEHATYVEVLAGDQHTETCAQSLRPGATVFITGSLEQDSQEDEERTIRSPLLVIARRLELLPGRPPSDPTPPPQADPGPARPS